MLPDMDGLRGGRAPRRRSAATVPIIFLTARDATEDKLRGLTSGGDDYVTKPFSLEELVARIRTILRRTGQHEQDVAASCASRTSRWTTTRARCVAAARLVELTATEYRLLRYLLLNPRRVLTRAQILDHVWDYDFGGDARVLETYISYLRKKLDAHGPASSTPPAAWATPCGRHGLEPAGAAGPDPRPARRGRAARRGGGDLHEPARLPARSGRRADRRRAARAVPPPRRRARACGSRRRGAAARRPAAGPRGGPRARSARDLPPGTYGERRDAAGRRIGLAGRHLLRPGARGRPRAARSLAPGHAPHRSGAPAAASSTGSASRRPGGGAGTTVVAIPLTAVDDTLDRLLLVLAVVIAGVVLLLGGLAWVLVGVGLRPLQRMGQTADAIVAGDLSRRVEAEDPRTEVGRLGLALNGMLARLEQAFAEREASEQRLRQFLADASHELRTPLASIRGYAELLPDGRAGDARGRRRGRCGASRTRPRAWACSSRTCSPWPASTRCASPCGCRSTSPRWRRDAVADARATAARASASRRRATRRCSSSGTRTSCARCSPTCAQRARPHPGRDAAIEVRTQSGARRPGAASRCATTGRASRPATRRGCSTASGARRAPGRRARHGRARGSAWRSSPGSSPRTAGRPGRRRAGRRRLLRGGAARGRTAGLSPSRRPGGAARSPSRGRQEGATRPERGAALPRPQPSGSRAADRRGGAADAVAAVRLRVVQGGVGQGEVLVVVERLVVRRHADAEGHRHGQARDGGGAQPGAQAARRPRASSQPRPPRARRTPRRPCGTRRRTAHLVAQRRGHGLEHEVADGVAVDVVDGLEVIQVADDDADGQGDVARLRVELGHAGLERLAVEEAGQWIDHGVEPASRRRSA